MVNDTIALALELAYITATLAAWLFLTTPILIYHLRSTHMKMPPTTYTHITIDYQINGRRHRQHGWYRTQGPRIQTQNQTTLCYTDQLLNWKRYTA